MKILCIAINSSSLIWEEYLQVWNNLRNVVKCAYPFVRKSKHVVHQHRKSGRAILNQKLSLSHCCVMIRENSYTIVPFLIAAIAAKSYHILYPVVKMNPDHMVDTKRNISKGLGILVGWPETDQRWTSIHYRSQWLLYCPPNVGYDRPQMSDTARLNRALSTVDKWEVNYRPR